MIYPKLVKEAYRKAFNYINDVEISDEAIASEIKFLEEYLPLKALEEIQQQPMIYLPREVPLNKPKEIALEAAVKVYIACLDYKAKSGKDVVCISIEKQAEEIYQWLIKENKA